MFQSVDSVQPRTQYLIAGSPQVASQQLNALSRSKEAKVRARVAEHSATPLKALARLLQDESAEVRLSLSYNDSLPNIFLAQLASDENPDVRWALAENFLLPIHILEFLANDENPYVAHRASLTLDRKAAHAKAQEEARQGLCTAC